MSSNSFAGPIAAPPYLSYFGFREAPFSLTPDTQFTFATRAHQEAVNTLVVAVNGGEGFIKIVGEVGTGKTLLCRRLLNALKERAVTAYVPNPNLSPTELLVALADEFQLFVEGSPNTHLLTKLLNGALLEFARLGKRVVVCIDEAQALPRESLETLRLLSNLETEKRKLVQIVLFGQPELDENLNDPAIRQLKQRITFHYRLDMLLPEELPLYLAHRMRIAGASTGGNLFCDNSIGILYKSSQGTPRLVNILANKALMAAYGDGSRLVTSKHVKAAARDTEGARVRFWW